MIKTSYFLAMTLLASISLNAYSEEAVLYQSDSEEDLSLYALVSLDVANEYLKPLHLEAVPFGDTGMALTGLSVLCFKKLTYNTPMGPLGFDNYCFSALPMLVSKPGTDVQGAYLFSHQLLNSPQGVALNQQLGIATQLADIGLSRSESQFPTGFQSGAVRLKTCSQSGVCQAGPLYSKLVMGRSTKSEFGLPVEQLINLQVGDFIPGVGNPVNSFELNGKLWSRPFDKKRDSYFVAPGTPEAKVINDPSFTPTFWQIGSKIKAEGRGFRVVADPKN